MGALQAAEAYSPDYPDYCREPMGKVVPKLTEPVWGPQLRWEILVENENKRIEWCANHIDEQAAARRKPAGKAN